MYAFIKNVYIANYLLHIKTVFVFVKFSVNVLVFQYIFIFRKRKKSEDKVIIDVFRFFPLTILLSVQPAPRGQ